MIDKAARERQLQSLIVKPGGTAELLKIRNELLEKAKKRLRIPSSAVVQDILALEYKDSEGSAYFEDIPGLE